MATASEITSRRAELACALRISERTAERMTGQARVLIDAFPDTFSGLTEGLFSYRHAQIVVAELAGLETDERIAVERLALGAARTQAPARFQRTVRTLREKRVPEAMPGAVALPAADASGDRRPALARPHCLSGARTAPTMAAHPRRLLPVPRVRYPYPPLRRRPYGRLGPRRTHRPRQPRAPQPRASPAQTPRWMARGAAATGAPPMDEPPRAGVRDGAGGVAVIRGLVFDTRPAAATQPAGRQLFDHRVGTMLRCRPPRVTWPTVTRGTTT